MSCRRQAPAGRHANPTLMGYVTLRCDDAWMAVTIPSGRPNKRFMRYVRPPIKDSTSPLFPLQPATRPMRLGIDVETVLEPPDGYLRGFLTRDEIEVHLLMPQGQAEPPAAWAKLLDKPMLHTVNFKTVAEADRFADAAEFHITTKSETEEGWSVARFFPAYQQFEEQTSPDDAPALTLDERHLAAAYAAGAGVVEVEAIVTNRATANRTDVGDNDIVVAVTPEEAVALIGHYLRVTSNPIVNVEVSQLISGGILTTTESTGTVVNSYLWGVTSAMPYFDVSVELIGAAQGGPKVAEALQSVHVRLARAARALDHILAALSNPLDKRRADVVEAAAEAFDRELLYLSAAFDIYGRLYRTLIDPSIDMDDVRDSLDSRAFIAKHLRPQYDESLLGDVVRLQVYAWVCKQLRNHIHKGILQVVSKPGRQYGNATNVALMLGGIPEVAPGADNGMKQDHYDALGTWMADPVSIFGTPAMVADLATAGFTLMGAALEYVEAFTKLILRNKPAAMIALEQATWEQELGDGTKTANAVSAPAPSRFLGCVQAQPGEVEPPPPERARFHRAIFGWHPPSMS
jgi:hypothetical protein